MIVIATNNGINFLKESLDSLLKININIPISIIDTGSNDLTSFDFLSEIKDKYKPLKIGIYKTPYMGYDTGAYIYAINNIKSDKYYFIHDSLIIRDLDFFKKIDIILSDGVVACLLGFGKNLYDNKEQIDFCIENIKSIDYDIGIFGPIFAIMRSDVDKIIDSLNFHPISKIQQMGMERGWSIIFKKYNIKVIPVFGDFDINKIINNKYSNFTKYLPHRNWNL